MNCGLLKNLTTTDRFMNPISFFLKKQFEIEDKIQHLLKDIQDMVLRYQNAF